MSSYLVNGYRDIEFLNTKKMYEHPLIKFQAMAKILRFSLRFIIDRVDTFFIISPFLRDLVTDIFLRFVTFSSAVVTFKTVE